MGRLDPPFPPGPLPFSLPCLPEYVLQDIAEPVPGREGQGIQGENSRPLRRDPDRRRQPEGHLHHRFPDRHFAVPPAPAALADLVIPRVSAGFLHLLRLPAAAAEFPEQEGRPEDAPPLHRVRQRDRLSADTAAAEARGKADRRRDPRGLGGRDRDLHRRGYRGGAWSSSAIPWSRR
jgi:hypothetical protein